MDNTNLELSYLPVSPEFVASLQGRQNRLAQRGVFRNWAAFFDRANASRANRKQMRALIASTPAVRRMHQMINPARPWPWVQRKAIDTIQRMLRHRWANVTFAVVLDMYVTNPRHRNSQSTFTTRKIEPYTDVLRNMTADVYRQIALDDLLSGQYHF